MLDVVNRENTTKHSFIALPASPAEMDSALIHAGAEAWDEVNCVCTDCQVPQLIDAITEVNNIAIANRFAEMLDRMSIEDVSKYKAVLEVLHCEDLTTASLLAQDLDNYMLSENIRNPEDMGRWQLDYMLTKEDQGLVLKHINLYAYGKEVLEQTESAAMSAYGLVDRRDNQPILAPTQNDPQMTMQ